MGQHLAGVFCQHADQLVLNGGQVNLGAAAVHAACGIVNAQFAVLIHAGLVPGTGSIIPHAAQRHAQPGQKLLHAERFGQVIVRTGIQGGYFVGIVTAGRNHQNGHIAPAADLADHLNTIHIRQAKVQKNHIRPCRSSFQQGTGPVLYTVVLIIAGFQRGGNQACNSRVILYNKDQRFIHIGSPQFAGV